MRCYCWWISAALLVLSGCGVQEKPVAIQPAAETVLQPVDSANTPANENSPDEPTPAPIAEQPTLSVAPAPPVMIAGVPPAPAAFAGQDLAFDAPIPPETQRKVESYDDDYRAGVIELLLNDPHPAVRQKAANRLGYGEEKDHPRQVLALRGALQDKQPKVRSAAANSLASIGLNAKDAVGELIPLIKDADEDVNYGALRALMEIGPSSAPAVPVLMEVLKSDKYPRRSMVIEVLGKIGPASKPAIPQLVKYLSDFGTNDAAAQALARLGAETELLSALKTDSSSDRRAIANGMGYLEKPSAAAIDALIKIGTTDEYVYARDDAMEALGKLRPTTQKIVAALVAGLADEKNDVRQSAARALGETEPKFDEALAPLLKATKDMDESVSDAATAAIGKYQGSVEIRLNVVIDHILKDGEIGWSANDTALREGAADFFPLLLTMSLDKELDEARRAVVVTSVATTLFSKSEFSTDERKLAATELMRKIMNEAQVPVTVRAAAALQLRSLREEHPAQTAAWRAGLLQGKFGKTRIDCARVMKWEDIDAAIPDLIVVAEDKDPKVAAAAIETLDEFEEKASAAVPVLVKLAQVPEQPSLSAILHALGDIGTQPELSRPVLEKFLDHKDAYMRGNAIQNLAKVIAKNDLDAAKLLPIILAQLKQEESWNKDGPLNAASTLGPKAAPLAPQIATYLTDKSDSVRTRAARTLGEIGPGAKAIAPQLVTAAGNWKDPNSAIEALGKIKAGGAEFAQIAPKLLDNLDVRRMTLETLGELGPDAAEAVPAMVAILDSPNEYERILTLEALAKFGDKAQSALPKLKELATNDEESNVRDAAVTTMVAIAPNDPALLELSLAKVADMRDEEVAKFLPSLGPKASSVVQAGLKSDSPIIRRAALKLVAHLPGVAERAAPVYIKALDEDDTDVRQVAAMQLAKLGKSSPRQIEVLVDSLNEDSNWEVSDALRRSGRAAIAVVVKALLDTERDDEARRVLVETLASLDNDGKPRAAWKLLQPALSSEDEATKQWSAIALTQTNAPDTAALNVLTGILKDAENPRRDDALQALWNSYGQPLPTELNTLLLELAASDDEEVSESATRALSSRPLDVALVPVVVKLSENDMHRESALRVMRNFRQPDARLVPALIAGLKSGDESQRYSAQDTLRQQGTLALEALVQLAVDTSASLASREQALIVMQYLELDDKSNEAMATLLKDESESIQGLAAVVLANNGYDWKPLAQPLLALFGQGYEDGHGSYAQQAIRERAAEAGELIAPLMKLAAEADGNNRTAYWDVLAAVGKDSPEVRQLLVTAIGETTDQYQASTAGHLLVNSGPAGQAALLAACKAATGEAVPRFARALRSTQWKDAQRDEVLTLLKQWLKSDDEATRQAAAVTLANLEPESTETLDILVAMLKKEDGDDNEDVYMAFNGLAKLGPRAASAVPALIELLDDEDAQYNAANVLRAIGPAAAPAVPKLIEMLANDRSHAAAVNALQGIGPAAKAATAALEAQLGNEQRMYGVAQALLKVSDDPATAVAALHKLLKDPNLRYGAVQALGGYGDAGKSSVPILIKALSMDDVELNIAAAHALGSLQEVAVSAAEPLVTALTSPDADLRAAAIGALGELHAQPAVVVPALAKALADPSPNVAHSAAYALSSFKQDAAPAVPALTAALEGADNELAGACANALGDIGAPAASAVPQLIALAEKPARLYFGSSLNTSAINALGQIGPPAQAAVPMLTKLHAKSRSHRQRAIATALWQIDPAAAKAAGAEQPPKPKE